MISHYNNLARFYNLHFSDLVTYSHFSGEKKIQGVPCAVFDIYKKKYCGTIDIVEKLPFRIVEEELISENKDIYHNIVKIKSFRIKPEPKLKFSELVDLIGKDIIHTHKMDYLAFKLILIIAYIDSIRVRFSTKPHFGKDSVVWQLHLLTNKVVNFTPKTSVGIELQLSKPLIVMNELKDLPSEQMKQISQLLHRITDDSPVYTRGAAMAKYLPLKDEYDIKNLSVAIFYNDREYSVRNKDYFDDLFDKPIQDRIMPFKFQGEMDMSQFDNPEYKEEYMETYTDISKTLEYYRTEFDKSQLENPEFDDNGLVKGRHIPTFITIKKWVKLYCDEKGLPFDQVMSYILDAYKRYYSGFYD